MTSAGDALLDRIVAHVAAHGLSDTSLRELAAAVGSSHRMLIYHFGSREGLLAAIVARIEDEQRAVLSELAGTAATPTEVVERQWQQLCDPALRPFVRLFFEMLAHALHRRPGTDRFLDDLTDPWLEAGAEAAERLGLEVADEELRLGIAVVRGLLIDVIATGETARPTAALERFLRMWEADRAGSVTRP